MKNKRNTNSIKSAADDDAYLVHDPFAFNDTSSSHLNLFAPDTPVHSNIVDDSSNSFQVSHTDPEYCESWMMMNNNNDALMTPSTDLVGGYTDNDDNNNIDLINMLDQYEDFQSNNNSEPRKIDMRPKSHVRVADPASAWNEACRNLKRQTSGGDVDDVSSCLDNKARTDDIISLLGNIDGTSLTTDDLQDLFGATGGSTTLDQQQHHLPPQDDVATVVSQSTIPKSTPQLSSLDGPKTTSFETSFDSPDMNLLSDGDYPAEMDLLDDDKLADDIISLLGTGF
jgi:hypothetical protein